MEFFVFIVPSKEQVEGKTISAFLMKNNITEDELNITRMDQEIINGLPDVRILDMTKTF